MVCKKCKSQISTSDLTCPQCGAECTGKKGLSKKVGIGLIIGVGAAALICAMLFLLMPAIKNAIIDNKAPNDYLKYVLTEKNSIADGAGKLTAGVKTASDGKVGISLEADVERMDGIFPVLEAVGEGHAEQIKKELSWLESVGVTLSNTSKNELAGIKVNTRINGQSIITPSISTDTKSSDIYVCVPEISSETALFNPEENGRDLGIASIIISHLDEIPAALPESELIENLVDRYLGIVFENLSQVSKEKDTLKVGNISQRCNVITVNLPYDDFYNITCKILEEAKEDEELRKAADPLMKIAAEVAEEYLDKKGASDIEKMVARETLKSELLGSYIDVVLTKFKEMHEEGDIVYPDGIVLELRTNNKHEIIGISLTVNDKMIFSAFSATKGSKFEDEIIISYEGVPVTVLSGSGKVSFGKKSGEYDIGLNAGYIKATLTDFDLKKWNSGGLLSGSVMLETGSALPKSFLDAYLGKKYTNIIENSDITLTLSQPGLLEAAIEANVRYRKKDALSARVVLGIGVPKSADISDSPIDVSDYEGVKQYVESISYDNVVDSLGKANVPEELRNMITNMEKGMKSHYE